MGADESAKGDVAVLALVRSLRTLNLSYLSLVSCQELREVRCVLAFFSVVPSSFSTCLLSRLFGVLSLPPPSPSACPGFLS